MHKILVLDDDVVILNQMRTSFMLHNYDIKTYNCGHEAIKEVKSGNYDLIISDLLMPSMSGDEFYKHVKLHNPDIPFVFLTVNNNLHSAVEIMKLGADDYIQKPIVPQDLVEKIKKIIEQKQNELIISQTLVDDIIDNRERSKIFSWKQLYGSKETEQTDKVMKFLSRNIEHAGGFKWLEMLKSIMSMSDANSEEIELSRTMLELIIESTDYIDTIISDLSYVTHLQEETLLLEYSGLDEFINEIKEFYESELIQIAVIYDKKISLDYHISDYNFDIEINMDSIFKILKELLYNSIKYSPDQSKIMIHIDIRNNGKTTLLELSYWNSPNTIISDDKNLKPILGIPYDYSESIFDLFYTMEDLPTRIPEEEWSQGTGLYIIRKMLQKMNGEISARNVIMHTPGNNIPYVKSTIYIPLERGYNE